MRMIDVINKKKLGEELTDEEIRFFIDGYVKGDIPDYQASAFAMAIYFRGMTDRETVTLTKAVAESGDTMDLSMFGDLSVDKHSTGGVGDKTSLIVTPIVAALGGKVTKMSGRGLGHTGGTVDKLESIPGFSVTLSEDQFIKQVEEVGLAIIGQSGDLTPADKKLYALRDVTGTIDSIPLIVSSIMGKKIAAGSKTIVLDVKVGRGAFMKTPENGEILARKMVDIGKACGRNMAALLSDMDAPLGNAIGNALEVKEAIAILRNEEKGELRDVCVELATQMISLMYSISEKEARCRVEQALSSGAAYEKMKEWIAAQGGDVSFIEQPWKFPLAHYTHIVCATADGFLTGMNAEVVGNTAMILGAGRASKEDRIDYSAGVILRKKVGDRVHKGDVLCELHTDSADLIAEAEKKFLAAITISPLPVSKKPHIYKIIR